MQSIAPVQVGWKRGDPPEWLLHREWLVTNGLGGYASGSLGGVVTRRFHGQLIAALPKPFGRTMMFNHLEEWITGPGGLELKLTGREYGGGRDLTWPDATFLTEFATELGLPVWRYSKGGIRIEKRVLMPHLQNTTHIIYRVLETPPGCVLHLRPSLHFRPHEGLLTDPIPEDWKVDIRENDVEITGRDSYPPLRIEMMGTAQLERDEVRLPGVLYRIEKSRGYEHEGDLWSPGVMRFELRAGTAVGIKASVEAWDAIHALDSAAALEAEIHRREALLERAKANDVPMTAQLVLAADQFLIRPHTRTSDEARAHAAGDEARTVIAGYHWFTDWGRDTMISLEGLTLTTGRQREAGSILRTFASYIRDGLIPNMFPEGNDEGLYHTADATLWFFHSVHRYVRATDDRATLQALLPRLVDIIDHHVRGTRFNIHVDPADGLLAQGQEGYQLTWMDAKVDDWVVTPRRGKAVEINALYYNALRILQQYLVKEGHAAEAERMDGYAATLRRSFNQRFWNEEGQYLYDVIDTPDGGADPALRPNQIFAVSLDYPVLDEQRWQRVVDVVRKELLTPVGLRSLARNHPDYKPAYDGDLRARDAAYHQGTVWSWLIGPFIDAWLKVTGDRQAARSFLEGFIPHLGDACIGTLSEVFDAESPYYPRGCVAQAWSVAEVLRCLRRLP